MMQAAFLLLLARAKQEPHVWFAKFWSGYSSCTFALQTFEYANPENEGTVPPAGRKDVRFAQKKEEHADCVSFLEGMASQGDAGWARWANYYCVLGPGETAKIEFYPLATASVAGLSPCFDETKGHLVWPGGTDSVLKEPPNSRVASLSTAHV